MQIGHVEKVKVFPFHFRKVETISLKPPIFGELRNEVASDISGLSRVGTYTKIVLAEN